MIIRISNKVIEICCDKCGADPVKNFAESSGNVEVYGQFCTHCGNKIKVEVKDETR